MTTATIATGRHPTAAGPDIPADEVHRRVRAIEEALAAAGDAVDPQLAARARAELTDVIARLHLGAGRTVVALVGGTGSGKSSLFNAISGLWFAEVGALRPTTDEAAACVWGGRADELLDHLQVAPARRITRESVLDAEKERALEGLVLLDLPDHDSVDRAHWEQVDRLVPLVDLLIWVVDPQKYADYALHGRYLRGLAHRQEAMLVLVNQCDTLPAGGVAEVCQDVRRLLAEDGLEDVPVLPTSATQRTGIGPVRDRLARAVAGPSAVTRAAHARLTAVADELGAAVGAGEADVDAAHTRVVDDLAVACGVPAVLDSVRGSVTTPGPGAVVAPEPPSSAAVTASSSAWLGQVTAGLPQRWSVAVATAAGATAELQRAAAAAVSGVPLPSPRVGRATALSALASLLAVGALVWAVAMGTQGAGWAAVLLPAVAAAGLALGAAALARRLRATAARRRADSYGAQVHEQLDEVVGRLLTRPAREVLAAHHTLRAALDVHTRR